MSYQYDIFDILGLILGSKCAHFFKYDILAARDVRSGENVEKYDISDILQAKSEHKMSNDTTFLIFGGVKLRAKMLNNTTLLIFDQVKMRPQMWKNTTFTTFLPPTTR